MFAWRAFPSRGDASTGPAGPGGRPAGPGAYLAIPSLEREGIAAAFTTRSGGWSEHPFASLNLSLVAGDDPATVRVNRARALTTIGADRAAWTSARQVHGSGVSEVGQADVGAGALDPDATIEGTDALVTSVPGAALVVLTADCLPVLLVAPSHGRVGVVHAGWRGLVAGVIEAGVHAMRAPDIQAFIGPSIGPCCFEVGAEVADPVADAYGADAVRAGAGGKPHVDLWRGARAALSRAGVGSIIASALCTRCEPHRFFSHRAGDTGRQAVVAMIR